MYKVLQYDFIYEWHDVKTKMKNGTGTIFTM